MKYKYKKVNVQDIANAISEYENTNYTHNEICLKYGINVNTFFYHLRKHRNQNGGTDAFTQQAGRLANKNDNLTSDNEKLVFINTNNKKMNAYMTQHNIKPVTEQKEPIKEKKRTRISDADLDKLFQSLNN